MSKGYRHMRNSRTVALKSPLRHGPQLMKAASLMLPIQPTVGSMTLPIVCSFCKLGAGPCECSFLSCLRPSDLLSFSQDECFNWKNLAVHYIITMNSYRHSWQLRIHSMFSNKISYSFYILPLFTWFFLIPKRKGGCTSFCSAPRRSEKRSGQLAEWIQFTGAFQIIANNCEWQYKLS